MAITLAQAKVGMANKVDQQVIDTFRRSSFLLDKMTFDDTVSPGTGGSTLVYGYNRLKTPGYASFRALNSEYTPGHAIREALTAALAIFGGSFEIDRVIAGTAGVAGEIEFQINQKVKAATNTFHNAVINGDTAVDANGFDGLNKALTDTSTEIGADAVIDLSTEAKVTDNHQAFISALESMLAELDGEADAILVSPQMKVKLNSVARKAGYYSQTEDAFGRKVDSFGPVPIVDLGYFLSDNSGSVAISAVIPTVTRTVATVETTGLTDIYAVRIGLDGFHGASIAGDKMVKTYLPDLKAPGAVKTGEVEFIATSVLKSSRAAGVLRNIKIA